MKRFIKKLSIFAIIILMITGAVNYIYAKWHISETGKFAAIPDTVQICNFGSSHGLCGFNYEDLENEYSCFNFGLNAQHLSYDYRLLQYYGDHIGEGAVVFIPVSYQSLYGIKETRRSEFLSKNKRYYFILPPSLVKEYDYKTDIYVRYFPALATTTSDLIKTLLGMQKGFEGAVWKGVATDIDVGEHAASRLEAHFNKKEIYYDDDGNRIENQEEIDALYDLIRGCQEREAVPILITTPFLREYTDIVEENVKDVCDRFYSLLDRVVEDTGAEYYDYAFDERFANEYSWFMNSDHLNKEGARNFTNIVMDEIVYAKGYLDK